MVASFLESIRYVGHMWPLALVRIFIGFQAVSKVLEHVQTGYLDHPYISERLNLTEGPQIAFGIYFEVFKSLIQSQWYLMTYVLIILQLIVGLSYILGLGVRIASLIGMILSIHLYLFFEFASSPGEIYLFYIHLLFCLLGAGRCLGLDFYFYKSRRGIIW